MSDVVVYSRDYCSFCDRAKDLLERKGVAYREIDTNSGTHMEEMIQSTGRFTVPQIFIGDNHVGGWDDLYALERAGSLSFTQTFGAHDWYAEGSKYLVDGQKSDGSWDAKSGFKRTVWDTCFAVLFLRRATAPVATEKRDR